MSKTDKILLGVLTLVICVALVLGQVLKKPSVVVVSNTTEAGQKALGYAEGTHLGQFTADYIESLVELKSVAFTATGAITGTAGATLSGADARIASLIRTGSVATFATTSAATAANVCNNVLWSSTSNGSATTTITLPATTTLFADCLTTNGDSVSFTVINADATTSTILAAGTGGTMLYESSLTIAATKAAIVTIVRDAATTYKALMVSFDN